ncbi:TVP38/TMEM64 family protein [Alienimonas chondri]|uniref:TVP38/TMEM64 family membrane protein n=1 Tax=Alienimonas chondri TaxID=2681879 RepID=A0ABX1VEQ6_9PLAN|nr:TVP38/TMEM64 family protein [Alienimonas chondri]NNJ26471.1 hypothetical protein [Alienimonas chondri]
MKETPVPPDQTSSGSFWGKAGALTALVALAILLYWQFGDYLDLKTLAGYEERLRAFGRENPALLIAAAGGIYVTAIGLSIPGAALLTLVYAWLFSTVFGYWPGLLTSLAVVSFSSTAGATLAFLLSRYLFRDVVRSKFPDRVAAFDERFQKDGPFYLFTLRLIVAVPFFVINVVMGLTPIRVWTYWWVSQLGMFPGTLVYCYAGSQFPSLAVLAEEGAGGILDWKLGLALAALGVFPLVVKKVFQRSGPGTAEAPADAAPPETA